MFKIGDTVYINKKWNFQPWYTEKLFTIIEFVNKPDDVRKIVKLDGRLPNTGNRHINVEYIIHSYIYDRKEKLKKINESRG